MEECYLGNVMQINFSILSYMNETILKRVEHKLLLALPPRKRIDSQTNREQVYSLTDWLIDW